MNQPGQHRTTFGLGSSWRAFAAVGGAVALVVIVIAALSLRGEDGGDSAGTAPSISFSPAAPTPTPSASATPEATAEPTAVPTPTPTAVAAGWELVSVPGFEANDIADRNGTLVAVGGNGANDSVVVARSTDGATWELIDLAALDLDPGQLRFVIAGDEGFVAAGGRLEAPADAEDSPYRTLVPFILFSPDGVAWEELPYPGPCTFAHSLVSGEFGFVIMGGQCRNEGNFDPRPIRVFRSADGRSWTSTTEVPQFDSRDQYPAEMATDGNRIVAIQGAHGTDFGEVVWISDDGGAEWRTVTEPFPEEITVYSITFGTGRFLAAASRFTGAGDPASAVCVSSDGEGWECPTTGIDLPSRVTATATGYVGLVERYPDKFTAAPTDIFVVTSIDGMLWEEREAPELWNILVHEVHPTSHGLFMTGSTNPNLRPEDRPQHRMAVHRGSLP